MTVPVLAPTPLRLAEAAVLLVLLPPAVAEDAPLAVALHDLQRRLGTAIQVLPIDEANYPAVVHSFDGRGLPAFVLLQHGVELWHQQGLPEGEFIAELLLRKLRPAGTVGQPPHTISKGAER